MISYVFVRPCSACPINPLKVFLRNIKYFFQRLVRGFDDSATFSVDYYLAKTMLPVLKRYKKIGLINFVDNVKENGLTVEEAVNQSIYAFEKIIKTNAALFMLNKKEEIKVCRGIRIFGQNVRRMWW